MAVSSEQFRIPTALRLNKTIPRRALVIASCFGASLPAHLNAAGCATDFILFNNVAELPTQPPRPFPDYDFQIVQIAGRSVLPDGAYFQRLDTEEGWDELFEETATRLCQLLSAALRWNREHGLLSFVVNFTVPQQNPLGRLIPRHDKRNIVRFFHRLNDSLSEEVARYPNAYVVDCDEIAASLGRRYVQDDVVGQFNHLSTLDYGGSLDNERIEPPSRVDELFPNRTEAYLSAVVEEIFAMFRTVRRIDGVKLVIVDLDDTLWRGMVVEDWRSGGYASEGYPLGLAEALLYLKARGILLAIVSKNDAGKIAAVWDHVWLGRLKMDDFSSCRINWEPKERNVEAVIREVNVLPESVVFIDDNPVERAAIQAAFPGIRILGREPFALRRILLWSPETQVPFITAESTRRTEMIRAQAGRETARSRLSRDAFLASLNVRTTVFTIGSPDHPQFPRAFELINKTNQFNTTGRRLTLEACTQAFQHGAVLHAFEVEDNYTPYGLVGVAVVRAHCIEQFVMSCRVIGLGVEGGVVERIVRAEIDAGAPQVRAVMIDTGANSLCRDLFERAGFQAGDAFWVYRPPGETAAVPAPAHDAFAEVAPAAEGERTSS